MQPQHSNGKASNVRSAIASLEAFGVNCVIRS